jgi:hypothetical protein
LKTTGRGTKNTAICAATEVEVEEETMRAQRLVETVEGNESL